jgi:hypothetical protein
MSLTGKLKSLLGPDAVDRLRDMRDDGNVLLAPLREGMVRRRLARERLTTADLAKFRTGVTLFFAPAAGIVPHFASHCILAKTLQDRGNPVILAGCSGAYPRCTVMEGSTTAMKMADRRPGLVCVRCGTLSADLTKDYGLDVLDIGAHLSPQDSQRIEDTIAGAPADLTEVTVDGIAFGKIAASWVSVSQKTLDFTGKNPAIRKAILDQIRGALISYYVMESLIRKIPVARVVFFSEYAMLLGAVVSAQRAGIAITNMAHAHSMSDNRQRPTLSDQPLALLTYRQMLAQWPQWRDLAVPSSRVDQLFDDVLFRFTSDAVMVYSRKRSGATQALFDRLRLSKEKPILAAFTSSLDEIYANRLMLQVMGAQPFSLEQPFVDQIAWLRHLIGHAETTGCFQLVIRIHPREGGNRRETISSEHLKLLRQEFDRDYQHTRIVWPQDDVSSYDLMEIANAGTSAWSSTAIEMARLGVPTVVAFRDYTPVPVGDVVAWSRTPDGYLDCIETALHAPPSLTRTTATMRWMNLRLFGHSVDLTDVVPAPEYDALPPFRTPAAAAFIEDVLIRGELPLALNHRSLVASQHPSAAQEERKALLRNLRRAAWVFTFGTEPKSDYMLMRGAPADGVLPPRTDAAAWVENGLVMFQTQGGIVSRRSRLVERLVTMITDAA